ncbi:MAG: hypothetical protein NTY74_14725 [Ignavibacteriae bacterium]|nr:hypothetical protein [Ignavibacteriota bacterium]
MPRVYKPYPEINMKSINTKWEFIGKNEHSLTYDNECLRYKDSDNYFDYKSNILKVKCLIEIDNILDYINKLNLSSDLSTIMVIRCYSGNSRQRFMGKSIQTNINSHSKIDFSIEILPGTLIGEAYLDFVILNNTKVDCYFIPIGGIIYQSDPIIIRIDGRGSVFPVYFVNDTDNRLWWIDLYINDPEEDIVNPEIIRLNINRSHPDFLQIGSSETNEITNMAFLKNIYAGAFLQLIVLLRGNEHWWKVVTDYNYDKGISNSIGALVNYGYRILWKDIDPILSPNKLFERLSYILDENLKERE